MVVNGNIKTKHEWSIMTPIQNTLLSCETLLDSCQSQLPTETYFREAMSTPDFST